ncbi:hypothetical protein BGZ76_005993 [Entomortierella beljakovae]|nr:hypothetical protein BGZ76_005993 [Entomortierella beljakovae]
MREALLFTGDEDIDAEMELLKDELKTLFPECAKTISIQKQYPVLAYLHSCSYSGPSKAHGDAYNFICNRIADEDEEESSDESDEENDPENASNLSIRNGTIMEK